MTCDTTSTLFTVTSSALCMYREVRPFLIVPLFQNESSCNEPFIYENEFDLDDNEAVGETHFHMNRVSCDD